MFDFKGKVAVVTGGAQGIGKCICEQFRKCGATVCVIDLLENDYFAGDLADKNTLEAFAEKVVADYGKVDFLINNAAPKMCGIENGNYNSLPVPGMAALITAIVSIFSKEAMYWYTRYYAKKIDSSALMADAWHHRSDAFSSIGALIGIGGARLGFPVMDSVASLVIFVFIAKAAIDIFKDAMNKMVDHSCDEETEKQIYDCIMKNENVKNIDLLQTRIFGNKIYIDVEIGADPSYTLREAHGIAEVVHDEIERGFPKVKHIMVHVNPATVEEQ